MTAMRRVALVTDDLMFASRLTAALGGLGISVVTSVDGIDPDAESYFVDLNRCVAERLDVIARLHRDRPLTPIIAFCGHAEKSVRIQAMACGATQVVTNGALSAVARRSVGVGPTHAPALANDAPD